MALAYKPQGCFLRKGTRCLFMVATQVNLKVLLKRSVVKTNRQESAFTVLIYLI
jgi:hypothetical protein